MLLNYSLHSVFKSSRLWTLYIQFRFKKKTSVLWLKCFILYKIAVAVKYTLYLPILETAVLLGFGLFIMNFDVKTSVFV